MRRVIGLFLLLALLACSPQKQSFQSIDLTGADYAKGFSLPDQLGQTRTLADFKGKVVLVFFGFTQCPDFCPTTLSEMAQIKKNLGPLGDKMQAIFISLDPERDTPELLKAYDEKIKQKKMAAFRNSAETRPDLFPSISQDNLAARLREADNYSNRHVCSVIANQGGILAATQTLRVLLGGPDDDLVVKLW